MLCCPAAEWRSMKSNNEQLKISIVTVCLNSAGTLERTMESVLSQNYANVDYIVIDGGSNDGTLDIIHRYEDRLSFWSSEPDRGIFDAMNKGIDHAKGDVIAFMNSDDWYEDGAFETVAECFMSRKADIVYGDYGYVTSKGTIYKNNKNFKLPQLKTGRMICQQSIFFRKDLFDRLGKFNLKYKIAADYEWTLKAYNKGVAFEYVPSKLSNFSEGGISTNYKTRSACMEEFREIAINALKKEEEQEYLPIIEANCKVRGELMNEASDMAERLIQLGNVKKIRELPPKQNKEIVLFGSGYYAEECIRICQALGLKLSGIVDNDQNKWGKRVHGILVQSPAFLETSDKYIIISSILYENEIAAQLEEMGYIRNDNYITMIDWERLLEDEYRQT